MRVPKKLIILPLLAGLIFGLIIPLKNVEAAAIMGDPWQFVKQFVIYPLVRAIANSLQSKLTNQINQQISNINGATPNFITNWRNNLLDSQGRGNDVFRALLADSNICSYMSGPVNQAFGADMYKGAIGGSQVKDASGKVVYQNKTNIPGMASFQTLANCTMPSDFNAIAFKNNFQEGGWEAWDRLLEPQNNFFGIYTMAVSEQQKQIQTEQKSTSDSAVAGNGFLASKLGNVIGDKSDSLGTSPTGCTSAVGSIEGGEGPTMTTRCTFMGKDVTPAYLKAGGAGAAIGSKINQPEMAQEITDVVLGLFASVLQGTIKNLSNYIGQMSYDSAPSGNQYDESQKQADTEDTQINDANSQVNGATTQINQNSTNIQNKADSIDNKLNNLNNPTPAPTPRSCLDICMTNGQTTCQTSCQNMAIVDPLCFSNCMNVVVGDCNAQCANSANP